jgi:uncharacterized repeat protein (TIGR01451 family)
VVWTETTATGTDIQAARYDPMANGGLGGWVALGISLNPGGLSGDGSAHSPIIVNTFTGPVVAYLDTSGGAANVYVKQFIGGAWIPLGAGAASGLGVSGSSAGVADLAIATDGGKVAVAWTQLVGGVRQVYLREYSFGGWHELAGSASGGGVSQSSADSRAPTLAYYSGQLFVAWQDNPVNYNEIYAALYNGTAWLPAGADGTDGSGISHTFGSATQPKLAAAGGQLYLLWVDDRIQNQTGSTIALYAKKWTGAAFAEELPGDASGQGISSTGGDPQALALAVDNNGHPFVAWSENAGGGPSIYVRGNTYDVGHIYYVNDGSQLGDEVCTAPGAAGNLGTTPGAPLPSVQAVLNAYTLQPGDVIVVDTGTYPDGISVPSGADSGFLVLGVPGRTAVIQGAVNLAGTSGVTLQGLNLAGGVTVSGSTQTTLTDNTIGGPGITLDGASQAQLAHNNISSTGAGLTLQGNTIAASIEHNTIAGGTQGILVTGTGATALELRDNQISGGFTGVELDAAAGGHVGANDISASTTGLLVNAAFTGLFENNNIHGAGVGVAYNAAIALSGNRIQNNATGVVSIVPDTTNGFGFVGVTQPNQIYANTTGVQLQGASLQYQHVYANGTGVTGTGSVVSSDLDHANLIEKNNVGVDVGGPVEFNRIASNTVGIRAHSSQLIAHNVLFRNTQTALSIQGQTDVRVFNNTFYTPAGDLVRVENQSADVEVRNNVFWTAAGYDLYVANNSQSGFFSDYNDLHASGTGKLVFWEIDFTDILDWQEDIHRFDLHSIGHTVVNPDWSQPRFYSTALDDYRVFDQSALLRLSSPTIDAGDPRADQGVPAFEQNLLTNPGFELGLTGWTANPSGTIQSSNPAPWDGNNYFTGGTNPDTILTQTVDLTAAGFTPAQLDAQGLVAVFGGRVRSAAETPPDTGAITLTFLDGSGNTLQSLTVPAQNVSDRWELVGSRLALPAGTRKLAYTFEAVRKSGPTSDSFLDGAFLYLLPNTYAPDQGAYGNTTAEAKQSPATHLALRFPDLYTDWEKNAPHNILWNTYSSSTAGMVRIDLYQDGPSGTQFLKNITPSTPDTGSYTWIPANTGIDYGTHGLRIQVTLLSDPNVFDRSTEPFAVPENTNSFFVNGASVTAGGLTTAAGSNRNTGKIASSPKPYPNIVLRIYTLGANQTLSIDSGTYTLLDPLVISATSGVGDDQGFTLTGPGSGQPPAVLSLLNPSTSAAVVEVTGANFVTLEHLAMQGGQVGLLVHGGSSHFTGSYLTVNNNAHDGLRVEAGADAAALDHITAFQNGGNGITVSGAIAGLSDSTAYSNVATGISVTDVGSVAIEANEVYQNGGNGLLVSNNVAGTTTVVGRDDLTAGRGNKVHDNFLSGIVASGNVLVVGNAVSGQTNANAAGISLSGAEARKNVVFGNSTGITGSGPITANRVYHNLAVGVVAAGGSAVQDNVVYSNAVGIRSTGGGNRFTNNLVYANSTGGVSIDVGNGTPFVSNTVYQTAGDALDINGPTGVQVRDNILEAQAGFDIAVVNASQPGFTSDYNDLFVTGTGQVGLWQNAPRATFSAWQNADFTDQNSLSQDPLFVSPAGADGVLGYTDPVHNGYDDDFHEQSQTGSFHGGALAPVLNTGTGLPSFSTATLTADAAYSPAIDRGDAHDSFANEASPNGGFVNLGAYGNTAQASESPTVYLTVLRPGGGEVWPVARTFPIVWRSHDMQGTVEIDLLQQGNPNPVLIIATAAPNNGEFDWTIPTSLTVPANYLIRVTRSDATAAGTSASPFTIAAATHIYYVNDSTVNPGDWTTAPGDDGNDGLMPRSPKATIQAVLNAYHPGYGDTIRVDAGTYNLSSNILIPLADSGVTILGYNDPAHPDRQAVINRGNTNTGSYAIALTGGNDVTLDHLVVTGGLAGIAAVDSGSQRLTVSNSEALGNLNYGIYLFGSSVQGAVIKGNRLHDNNQNGFFATYGLYASGVGGITASENVTYNEANSGLYLDPGTHAAETVTGNTTFANPNGIQAFGKGTVVSANTVYSNTSNGIVVGNGVLAVNNTVYGQNGSQADGIDLTGGEARQNTVFDNTVGITGGGLADNNRVFHNSGIGIVLGSGTIQGNTAYSNGTGIVAEMSSAGPTVLNNLVYANTNLGINAHGYRGVVMNNTVYQPTGDALLVDQSSSNVQLENNILWAVTGHDVVVAPDSENGFQSDYNDLVVANGNLLGNWEGRDFTNRTDWFYELGFDQHSTTADPQFVNPAGLDGILGYSTATTGPAQIVDDVVGPSFNLAGAWVSQVGGYGGSSHASNDNNNDVATWTITGLTPGTTYHLAVTWPVNKNASATPFAVADGGTLLASFTVDQRLAPADFTDGGVPWKVLGTFYVTTGSLTVTATHRSFAPVVIADAVRVQAIQGDSSQDDNFHVQAGSPTIDAGDPLSPYGNEPAPNGGRVNQGYDGNKAAPSVIRFIQNLSPAGLEKFQVGQTVPVTWRSVGIYGPAGYYSNDILAGNPVAYYRLGDSGTTAADATGHGLNATYTGGVTHGLQGALPSDPDTAVQLDGSSGLVQLPSGFADFTKGFSAEVWVFPTAVKGWQAFFDLASVPGRDNILFGRENLTNNLYFQVYSGGAVGAIVRAPGAIELNKWQHFAVTEDAAGNVTLYKNGVVVGTGTTYVPRNVTRTQNQLGRDTFGNAYYAGLLDEAAFYNQVLPAARIQDHVNHAFFGTVNIDLLRDSDPNFVQSVADHAFNNGSFAWTVPLTLPLVSDYRIRVHFNGDGVQPQAITAESFLVTNNGHDYYVNDNSTAGDVFTTAVGNNANSGKSPDQPVASLPALLTAYTFGPGDVIHVDTGTYNLIRNVGFLPSASGVTVLGPSTAVALFNRGNTNTGANTFELDGAVNVTLDHLSITGGVFGVQANDTGSTGLTVSNSNIFGNVSGGINLFGNSVGKAVITNNQIHDNHAQFNFGYGIGTSDGGGDVISNNVIFNHFQDGISAGLFGSGPADSITGNLIYANRNGIEVGVSATVVSGNTVYNNSSAGIAASGGVVIVGNTVFGQSAGTGISVRSAEARQNIVFNNGDGISDGGLADNNRVFHNTGTGIVVNPGATAQGNQIYSNADGIQGFNASNDATRGPYVRNNLVYANTFLGIAMHGGADAQVTSNTVYQPTGDGLLIDGPSINDLVENNIIWTKAGHDIVVSADNSELNLQCDYNDLYTTDQGIVGHWEDADFATRADWFYQVGLDRHSISADPQFVNPAGADGMLGYSAATTGPAQVVEDVIGPKFNLVGAWVSKPGGSGGSYHVSNGGNDDTATWTVSGLTPGTFYQLALTWPANNFASGTPYTVSDGGEPIASGSFDQRAAPSDFTDGGVPWKTLGIFFTYTGTLSVTLTHSPYYYPNVIADALRVQAVQGDHGADDDFHVLSSSPTIDAGDPVSPFGNEPGPNGHRINQGNYGNTAGATPSPPAFVQVLSPVELDKAQAGLTLPVSWRTLGVNGPAGYYSSSIQADNPLAYYRLDDAAGTPAADSSGHGLNGTYAGGVTNSTAGALWSDPDTAVQLDGSGAVQLPAGFADFTKGFSAEVWVYPTAVSHSAAFFDLSAGPASDNILLGRDGSTNDLYFQVFRFGSGGGTVVHAPGAIELNKWQHFAVTEDAAGNVTLYKNGVVIGTGTTFVPRNVPRTQSRLGRDTFNNAGYIGFVDEVAFFNQALPAARVQDHYNHAFFGTVNLDLVQAGNSTPVARLADHVADNGSFLATIPASVPLGPGYQVLVSVNDGAMPSASSGTFLIANNGHDYYVNDASTAGDVFTTAAGNDANSGKSPDQPVVTLRTLLASYTFGPGDVIHVDTGHYRLYRNVLLLPQDSGVTIQGPTGAEALLDRANTNLGAHDIDAAGGTNITLDHLSLTGGRLLLDAETPAGSKQLTLSNDDLKGSFTYAVFIDLGNDGAVLTNNRIHDNTSRGFGIGNVPAVYVAAADSVVRNNQVFGNVTGIQAVFGGGVADQIVIRDNIIHDNSTDGVIEDGDVLVTSNQVFNNTTGIFVHNSTGRTAGAVTANVVYGNSEGILTEGFNSERDTPITGNRVFHNSTDGIHVYGQYSVIGNQVYSNPVGIIADHATSFSGSIVANNIVYANTNQGILVIGNKAQQLDNNTVYQPVGDAIRIQGGNSGDLLYNNILWVDAGYDLNVAQDSQSGFVSDYNLFNKGPAANAHVGFWNNATQDTFANWQTASGQDAHGLFADPLWVDRDGADNVLGYTTLDGGADDNFYLMKNSPAIDRGYSWPVLATDSLGVSRKDDPGSPNAGSPTYAETQQGSSQFAAVGKAQNFHANQFGDSFTLNLPFAFPFYDGSYTSVTVSSRGLLKFAGSVSGSDGANSDAKLEANRIIAPFWANLRTDLPGNDIFVDTSVVNQVTVRWNATSVTDGSAANFSVTLFKDGHFRFDYGAGNANQSPTIGISFGNGQIFLLSGYDGRQNLANVPSLVYDLSGPGITDIGAIEFRVSSLITTPATITGTTPGLIDANGATGNPISQFQVSLSEEVNPIDANAPAAYELRKAGSGGFGSPDDVIYPLTPHYTTGATTVSFDIGGLTGTGLPVGSYRFTIFSTTTTSIHDLAGLRLDGDGDGIPGGNYVRTFTIQPPKADLNVTVTVDNSTPIEGGTVTFTVTVDNNAGPQGASNVQVTDLLPSTLTLQNASPPAGTTYDPTTGLWSVGSLAPGASAVLKLTATVNAGTVNATIQDMATATATEFDPNPANNQFTASLTVQPSADLNVSQTLDDLVPLEGEVINYTVTVDNLAGPEDATGVRLTDLLPADVTLLNATPSVGTFNSTTSVWTVGSLAVKASAQLVITVQVKAGVAGDVLKNTATVAADQPDPNPANNTNTRSDQVQLGADLNLSMTVDNPTPIPGGMVQYTLTVDNKAGPDDANDVTINEKLPDGLELVSFSTSLGTYQTGGGEGDDPDAGGASWYILTLPAGATATLTLTAQLDTDIAGQTIVNTASIERIDELDKNLANNVASAAINVRYLTDLNVTQTVDVPKPIEGQVINYQITVDNNAGPDPATGVQVTDLLPAGVTFQSAMTPAGTMYDSTTGVWSVGTLAQGASATLVIAARVNLGTVNQTISNTATATLSPVDFDPNTTNNTATTTITIQPSADLALSQTVDNPNPGAGTSIQYTLALNGNAGPEAASNVLVTDLLPAGVTFVRATASTGTIYTNATGIWNVSSLALGASATLQITVTLNAGTVGQTITNTARITAADQADPNPSNNVASATVTVQAATKLFDFNAQTSPTAIGFVGVLPTTTYTIARGYGWITPTGGTAPTGFYNANPPNDPLLQDGNSGTDDIFAVDQPAANYLVTLILGDAATSHDQVYAKIDGTTVISNLTIGRGQFISRSFPVTLTAGQQLQVELSDADPRSSFAINALTVQAAPVPAITWSGPSTLVADGTSTATFTGTVNLPDGSFVTVASTLGTITAVSAADGSLTTADANPNYAGIQAVVKSGLFKVVLQSGTGAGTATLSGQEVTGAAAGSTNVTLTVAAARKFQFVASLADGVSGEIGVLAGNLYSASRGYGWTSWGSAVHRTDGTVPFNRDGEIGTTGIPDNTFRVQIDLTQPSYTFTVHFGDYDAAHSNVAVYVNDATSPTDMVSTAAGQFLTRSYTVTQANFPTSGILDIRFAGTAANGFFFVNGVDIATPLQADPTPGPVAAGPVTPLTQAELAPVAAAAVKIWEATRLSPALAAKLEAAPVRVAHLGGPGYLGVTGADGVLIDDTAAGFGWFVDMTPSANEEFGRPGVTGQLRAAPGSPAYGREDLLTVVLHELGHVLGLPDLDPAAYPGLLMSETLPTGTRRLPAGALRLPASLETASVLPLYAGPVPVPATVPALPVAAVGSSSAQRGQASVKPLGAWLASLASLPTGRPALVAGVTKAAHPPVTLAADAAAAPGAVGPVNGPAPMETALAQRKAAKRPDGWQTWVEATDLFFRW